MKFTKAKTTQYFSYILPEIHHLNVASESQVYIYFPPSLVSRVGIVDYNTCDSFTVQS